MEADRIRLALAKLKERFASGELDEGAYRNARDLLLEDLTPEERAALGISGTPRPVMPGGTTPPTGTSTPVGPSGGVRGGLRTARVSLADLDLGPGTVLLGQWKLIRELGRGGFGAVFEAEELSLGERHAVKVLDPAMVAKDEFLARFRREVSLMRKLVHPRIVRVYDYREDLSQNLALISMELVAEGSVKQLLSEAKKRGEPIPVPLALNILGQILEALAEAHGQGVIHRDVTPGNVLISGGTPEKLLANPGMDPQVKLVDFGIAGLVERTELSAKSRVLGTAAYVAPEVLDSSVEVTPQADVYGAGAMGYELVTGRLPAGRFDEPIELRPEIGRALNRYLLKLVETRPAARPGSDAAARQLRELRSEGPKRQEERAGIENQSEERSGPRQAERDRPAGVSPRQGEAPPSYPSAPQSLKASGWKSTKKRGVSMLVRLGRLALIAAVVGGVGWGVLQHFERERQQVLARERRETAAVAEQQRESREGIEAERRQARLLEAETQRAAAAAVRAERDRVAQEWAEEKKAETAQQEQQRIRADVKSGQQRPSETGAQRDLQERKVDEDQKDQQREAKNPTQAQDVVVVPAEPQQEEYSARPGVEMNAKPLDGGPGRQRRQVENPAGISWVTIPSGSYLMGCNASDKKCDDEEKPPHRVAISAFEIAATETTVEQFRRCLSAGVCRPPKGAQDELALPVVGTGWQQASAFCKWSGGRLPTEAEWEYAARGGLEGQTFPWGDEAPVCTSGARNGAQSDSCRNGLIGVKAFAPNKFGVWDMAGNASEWVSDWFDEKYYRSSPASNPTGPGLGKNRVLRGGSWRTGVRGLRVSDRDSNGPGDRDNNEGFRCVRTGHTLE